MTLKIPGIEQDEDDEEDVEFQAGSSVLEALYYPRFSDINREVWLLSVVLKRYVKIEAGSN